MWPNYTRNLTDTGGHRKVKELWYKRQISTITQNLRAKLYLSS